MKSSTKVLHKQSSKGVTCYSCGKKGLLRSKSKLWCQFCKKTSHSSQACRRKQTSREYSAKQVNYNADKSEFHSFAFMANSSTNQTQANKLLVDCGATTHIVTKDTNFSSFDKRLDLNSHVIELADGPKLNNVAFKRGNVAMKLKSSEGDACDISLENALYMPSYPQDIFSVQAATEKGATVILRPDSAELITESGTKFDIEKQGRLYYLCSNVPSTKANYPLQR